MDTPMTDEAGVPCTVCGAMHARSDMFGAEPHLHCPRCAEAIRERYRPVWSGRVRQRTPYVASTCIAAAAALFVASHVIHPRPAWVDSLVTGPQVWSGEAWRLLTSAFLHIGPGFGGTILMGVLHVGFNCWWMATLGRTIESHWGSLALAALVVSTAVVASAVQWIFVGPGIGLSGVVFGLAGFLFALRGADSVADAVMNPRTVNSFVTWFILCIVLTQSGSLPVANWAHAGGALSGLASGYALRARSSRAWLGAVAIATIAVVLAAQFVAFGDRATLRAAWLEWTRVTR
jgi:membrane associated rhomboid family serine protease